jgi:hypothetical protein
MRKAVLLVKANGELYLVESVKFDQSKITKGQEYYDGKGNIRIWGTGHVYDLDSKRIVATPDQIGLIEESQENNATCVRDMIQADFDIILERRQGECFVEVDGTPYPDGVSRPIYYQHKVLIHIN